MTSSYCKTSVFTLQHVKDKAAFSKISTLESVFERCVFRDRFSRIRAGGRLNREKKKTDTCGQGFSGAVKKYNVNSTFLEKK